MKNKNIVPQDDLPANLVPQNDLPDNLSYTMGGADDPFLIANNSKAKPVLIGGVEKNVLDFLSGFNRGVNKLFSPITTPASNALAGLIGLKPKSFEQVYPEIDSLSGKTGEFTGSLGASFILPQAKLFSGFKNANLLNQTLSGVYQGGIIGASEDFSKNGKIDLANTGISAGLGGSLPPSLKGFSLAYRKTAPNIAQFFAGIPKESFNRALDSINNGVDFFKGKFDPIQGFKDLGNRTLEAISNIRNSSGGAADLAAEALHLKNVKIPKKTIDKIVNRAVSKFSKGGKISSLQISDLNLIRQIRDKINQASIGEYISPLDLHDLKQFVQDLAVYNKNFIEPISNKGNMAIKEIGSKIKGILDNISPEYKELGEKYKEVMDLVNDLGPRSKDANIAKTIKNLNTDTSQLSGISDTLQSIDNLTPDSLKFYDDIQDLLARQDFERYLPLNNANRLGLYGYGSVSFPIGISNGNFGLFGLTPIFSPKAHKLGLQLYSTGRKVAPILPKSSVVIYNQLQED